MIYDFNADDIFEMAEQMERNGAKFYRTAAESSGAGSAKDLLLKSIFLLLRLRNYSVPDTA